MAGLYAEVLPHARRNGQERRTENGTEKYRTIIRQKVAFIKAGLEDGRDFHVKVQPVKQTNEDFWRLCHYILKFNGGYTYNRRKPRLFLKGLKIRKVGCIGRWFVKASILVHFAVFRWTIV